MCGALRSDAALGKCLKLPGEWQSYDIIFESPRWDREGTLLKKANVTVVHNGVVVHHRREYLGATDGIGGVPHTALGAYLKSTLLKSRLSYRSTATRFAIGIFGFDPWGNTTNRKPWLQPIRMIQTAWPQPASSNSGWRNISPQRKPSQSELFRLLREPNASLNNLLRALKTPRIKWARRCRASVKSTVGSTVSATSFAACVQHGVEVRKQGQNQCASSRTIDSIVRLLTAGHNVGQHNNPRLEFGGRAGGEERNAGK